MMRELEEADRTGADKKGIYAKYGRISEDNRNKTIAEVKDGDSFDAIGAWSDLNGGIDVADGLKWTALVDDLSSEDRAQLVNFVKAENAQSAQAIYDSLSITAKGALLAKEAGENIGIGGAVPGAGISVAGTKGSGNKGIVLKQPNPSNVKPDNSVNIATNFTKTPQAIWGRSTDDIAKDFKAAGYQVNVRQSSRGSGQAVIIEVKGHPEISQIQYHSGGGRHGGSYYKVSTTTQGTMKVVDPSTYKPTQGEKATIINKTKE
ncbi:hypothetical protein [Providencia rettgeri]|uniref:hypothetical protein n=1 Tax=Providencia rettgeri TaxID=587 RepID=UPI001657F03D|nr:hypothetical protein H9L31_02920 [Providencia rettgeri]